MGQHEREAGFNRRQMAGKGDGDGWALFVDMRDAPWSVSGWQVGGCGVVVGWTKDQGLAELGKERVVLWPRVAKVSSAEKPSAPHQPEHPPRSLQTYKWATSDRLRMILGVFSFCTARNPHIICLIFSRVTFFESNIFVNTNLLQTQNVLLPTNIPPFICKTGLFILS